MTSGLLPQPLADIRVLDLSTVYSGPMAAALLADQGAEVIKVESPNGDICRRIGPAKGDISATFIAMNRGKRSIAIDLKSEQGKAVLTDLITRTDVLMENFRPGVMAKLGFDCDRLQQLNPRVIYLSITGFGQDGPYTKARVYDAVIQAVSGMCASHLEKPGGDPGLVATTICDKLTSMTAAQAVTAALLARQRDGHGRVIDLSMLDSTLAFNWPDAMYNHMWLDDPPPNWPEVGGTLRPYKTRDGYLTTMTPQQDEFAALCKGLGAPELAQDPRFSSIQARSRYPKEIRATLEALFAKHATDEVVVRLHAVDAPVGKVNLKSQVIDDPQVVHNRALVEIDHGSLGRVRVARAAALFENSHSPALCPAPHLGEHSEQVLRELGYDEAHIAALNQAGTVMGMAGPDSTTAASSSGPIRRTSAS
jgi:crotonobetainyl-CoA:carnitine CoA-transferase CaiB-like acyl-CoA transferase